MHENFQSRRIVEGQTRSLEYFYRLVCSNLIHKKYDESYQGTALTQQTARRKKKDIFPGMLILCFLLYYITDNIRAVSNALTHTS